MLAADKITEPVSRVEPILRAVVPVPEIAVVATSKLAPLEADNVILFAARVIPPVIAPLAALLLIVAPDEPTAIEFDME